MPEELGGTQAADRVERAENRRETGARKEEAHPESHERDDQLRNARELDETHDRGLMVPVDEVDDETHQTDGVDQDVSKR